MADSTYSTHITLRDIKDITKKCYPNKKMELLSFVHFQIFITIFRSSRYPSSHPIIFVSSDSYIKNPKKIMHIKDLSLSYFLSFHDYIQYKIPIPPYEYVRVFTYFYVLLKKKGISPKKLFAPVPNNFLLVLFFFISIINMSYYI